MGDPRLVIVRRGHFATFELLSRTIADDSSVQIIWDRRMGERRRSPTDLATASGAKQRPPTYSYAVGPATTRRVRSDDDFPTPAASLLVRSVPEDRCE